MGKVHWAASRSIDVEARAYAEARVSYQAQAFVRSIRGASRGEKALLMALSYYHDHRTGHCKVSNAQLADDAEMSERHVMTLIQKLEFRQILRRRRDRDGRGSITSFEFLRMPQKGELTSPLAEAERVKSATGKGEICAQKGELASPCNKERAVKASNTENLNPPYPPFSKGGTLTEKQLSRLRRRMHTILRDINRTAGARVGSACEMTYEDILREACNLELIPFEDAHPYVNGIWEANRKPVRAAV